MLGKWPFFLRGKGSALRLLHENMGPWPLSLVFVFKLISTFNSQNPKFFMHMLTKDVLLNSLTIGIAHEKQT
jgi:hypothetical protein